MKKTSKSTKSLAPATRTAAKSAAKTAPAAPVKAKSATKAKPVRAARSASAPAAIVITARIDVGFGNHLTLRGEGAGLNWEQGVRLENLGSDHWRISLAGAAEPVRFKFLLNDELWCEGDDFVAGAGGTAIFTPVF